MLMLMLTFSNVDVRQLVALLPLLTWRVIQLILEPFNIVVVVFITLVYFGYML